ncbi:hypothetical protein JF540_22840 [Salipiger thiooxidans]|uniref:hypothetical protein n=1 Tax=Salipiger thiooxidans TaxID=282683 RepID=UPI001A8E4107|nr:hypothetical protein [Salipiger thiooxidans]MBN8189527.1 hypothetical protein [Salipiger thiooxidans]
MTEAELGAAMLMAARKEGHKPGRPDDRRVTPEKSAFGEDGLKGRSLAVLQELRKGPCENTAIPGMERRAFNATIARLRARGFEIKSKRTGHGLGWARVVYVLIREPKQ